LFDCLNNKSIKQTNKQHKTKRIKTNQNKQNKQQTKQNKQQTKQAANKIKQTDLTCKQASSNRQEILQAPESDCLACKKQTQVLITKSKNKHLNKTSSK
jgi:hypothetical protein